MAIACREPAKSLTNVVNKGERIVRERRIGLGIGVALLLVLALLRHPTADIRILTHDAADRTPARVQAALDLGVIAVSVLVTWTKRLV